MNATFVGLVALFAICLATAPAEASGPEDVSPTDPSTKVAGCEPIQIRPTEPAVDVHPECVGIVTEG